MQSITTTTASKASYLTPQADVLEVSAPKPVCSTGDDMDPGEEHW